MSRYLVERLFHGVLVLFGITLVGFVLINLTGDPVRIMLGPDATQQQVDAVRQEMGLDQPLPVQYVRYMTSLLTGRGQLGRSFLYSDSAINLVISRLPATLQLALAAMVGAPGRVSRLPWRISGMPFSDVIIIT